MKIGIDIDGVILDLERSLKTYGELYNFLELNKEAVKNKNKHYLRDIYDWSSEERKQFVDKYFVKLTNECSFMPGAVDIINRLKNDGHELIIISARGGTLQEMIDAALNRIKSVGLEFDKYYWKQNNKLDVALAENLDFMIDDIGGTCKKLSKNKIHALYFKDVNMKTYKNNKYFTEVTNWGEIYRIIKTASDKK